MLRGNPTAGYTDESAGISGAVQHHFPVCGAVKVETGRAAVVGAAHDRAGIAGRSETLRDCLVDGCVAGLIEIACQRDIRAGGDDTADANQSDIPVGIRHLDPARDRG